MNRDRFEAHNLVGKFFNRVVAEGIIEGLITDDRFVVDGTLIRSLAGHKSIEPINTDKNDDNDNDKHDDANAWSSFKGKKRTNATRRSVVDPDARLMSKGGGGARTCRTRCTC